MTLRPKYWLVPGMTVTAAAPSPHHPGMQQSGRSSNLSFSVAGTAAKLSPRAFVVPVHQQADRDLG